MFCVLIIFVCLCYFPWYEVQVINHVFETNE